MHIAVGSTNPTKLAAVQAIFRIHFEEVAVIGRAVESGVSEQPMSVEEMYTGALNRAKGALTYGKNNVSSSPAPTYGVGIEGGLQKYSFGWFESSLVVVINRQGKIGVGSSGGLVLPPKVMELIHNGKNLEQAIDDLFGTKGIGKGIGMFGVMTKEVVTRTSGTQHGVAFALAPFLHPEVYGHK